MDKVDTIDGRKARGHKRRVEIIEATLAVVRRDGAAGVTHRSVAQEAGIPVSLSTYYFATIDDLLVAALTSVANECSKHIHDIIDNHDDKLYSLANLIVTCTTTGREKAIAERELSTLAVHRPALQPIARRWFEDIETLAATITNDPTAVAALVTTSDGLCTALLLGNIPADVQYVRKVLAQAIATN